MVALSLSRADLRGRSQTDDSFMTLKGILTPFTTLCTFATDRQDPRSQGIIRLTHPGLEFLGRGLTRVSYGFLDVIRKDAVCKVTDAMKSWLVCTTTLERAPILIGIDDYWGCEPGREH